MRAGVCDRSQLGFVVEVGDDFVQFYKAKHSTLFEDADPNEQEIVNPFDKAPVNSRVRPSWGIVTDMNEFRLYHRKTGGARFLRFVIDSADEPDSLTADSTLATRRRFLFFKAFSREFLLASSGKSKMEKLLERQWVNEKLLENHFYREYQEYRQHVYEAILDANPTFAGTHGELVRMTQRFLDRCIFLLFCEDMGKVLHYPTDLLRDILIRESNSPSYSPEFDNIWSLMKQLLRVMRDGGLFPPDYKINAFNGGLFADLEDLEAIRIPNRVFCAARQGETEERLRQSKNTLRLEAVRWRARMAEKPSPDAIAGMMRCENQFHKPSSMRA